MSSSFFPINLILTACIYIVILRLWMQFVRVNFHNQITQMIIKSTQPIIGPLRKLIPSVAKLDTATILVLYLLCLLKITLMAYFIDIPIQSYFIFYALILGAHSFGSLIFWLLLIRAILSWVSRGQSSLEEILYQLTEPLIRPIRRVVPPIGNIDLSFMIFIFILFFLNLLSMNLFADFNSILFNAKIT